MSLPTSKSVGSSVPMSSVRPLPPRASRSSSAGPLPTACATRRAERARACVGRFSQAATRATRQQAAHAAHAERAIREAFSSVRECL
eukprot:6205513-Pleurochrysis_carterae.AAC.2